MVPVLLEASADALLEQDELVSRMVGSRPWVSITAAEDAPEFGEQVRRLAEVLTVTAAAS